MKEKITLAIFDENQLQKELLHHQLEQMRYDVYYSTLTSEELKKYFDQRPADVILVSGQNDLTGFPEAIQNFRMRKGKLKVLFYNAPRQIKLEEEIIRQKGAEAFFSMGGWANLFRLIDSFTEVPEETVKKEIRLTDVLSPDNPFYKISENQKYVDILRYLKEGKSYRQIAYLLGTSINNVKYHINKMHDETGSNTTKMVADAIMAGLI